MSGGAGVGIQRLYALLDELEEEVAVLDGADRYRYANRAYAARLGRDPDGVVGRSCAEVLGSAAHAELAPHLAEARSGRPVCRDEQLPGASGALRWYRARFLPGAGDGEVALLAADVTARRRAEDERNLFEERLAQAQRMEALGTLAGGIAHDFNNILGVVMGYSELSLLKLDHDTPVRPYLEQVIEAADRAKNVVRQILAFSRTAEHERQPVALVPLVKEVLKLLRATLPATIEIVEEVDPDTPQVDADPSQLHQVVINLCTNAYQAMREHGGRLTVGLAAVSRGAGEGRSWVELRVSDTGCGMSPRVRRRAFDPYFTTRPAGEGTGMGLAVVHGIVTGLDGKVSVESEPDRGTEFRVLLPALEAPRAAVPRSAPVPAGRGEHVLFVDDEAALARLGEELLGSLGYRVTATTSSRDALARFRADPDGFDCVITDQTLPEMTGAELATELLRLRPELPVVLCTGYSDLIDAAGARGLGARAFLVKPLDLSSLAGALAEALGHPRPAAAG